MAAASNDKKKVMDVAKPGKSAPNATTRPLIVSHGGMIIDPTVNDDVKSAPVPSSDALNGTNGITTVKPRGPKVVRPLSDDTDKSEEATQENSEKTEGAMPALPIEMTQEASEPSEEATSEVAGPAKQEATEQESSMPAEEESNETAADSMADESSPKSDTTDADTPDNEASESSKDEAANESESAAIVDAVVDQANVGKKQKEEDKEAIARKELVSKLVDEKKYFIPIRQRNTTRSGRMSMVLSILGVLVLLGGYAAVDAGVINPGFDVPFHLIGKKEIVATSVATPAATPVANTATPAQPTTPATTPAVLDYSNKELGVSFSYPSTWGDVGVKKQTSSLAGTNVSFTFSKQPMLRAGMISKDYKAPGKDGVCYELLGILPGLSLSSIKAPYADGDSTYNTATYKTTTKFLKTATDTLVYERFEAGRAEGMGGCDGLTVTGYRSFTVGSYTGIQFFWANPDTTKVTPVSEFSKYKSTPDNYLSEADRKAILAVVESAKAQ